MNAKARWTLKTMAPVFLIRMFEFEASFQVIIVIISLVSLFKASCNTVNNN